LATTFDTNQRIINLWENFQNLSAIEAPVREEGKEMEAEDADEEYDRLKKLLADNEIEVGEE